MSDKLIKLTDQNMRTHNESFQWELGKKYEIEPDKRGTELCTDQVFHAYRDIDLALLLNPIHADIPASELRIFDAEGSVVDEEWDKVGTHDQTLKKELPLPEWYADVNVRIRVYAKFAALAAAAADDAALAAAVAYAADASYGVARAVAYAASHAADAADAADAAARGAYSKIDFVAMAKLAIKEALNDPH